MSQKWKSPGNALQRTTGASVDGHWGMTIAPMAQTYANCRDLQTRHLQRRFGLDARTARLMAGLCFGEDR
ncbi:hypothetical protein SAMN05443432_1027 [Roseovarius litoreus]|uniref:Uncharacterized protein n=1 Tax=Roseovarius litoreus TaxID=1155722 RepID=A0A1M7C2M0_9RHOB|nr:hypothetical protein [Roseovarius litoreus]SHL61417.1 hypothetical protein SAMN05443432_1027 [Roseovarius litoreus]